MENQTLTHLFEQITAEYLNTLLHWAMKKTGDRNDAADLAQEVMLQIFLSASREFKSGREIEKVENFVWKVAHNVWCSHLRKKSKATLCMSFGDVDDDIRDDDDFAARMGDEAEMKELISQMRRNIIFLNKMQRETMILHYIEGKSIREIAVKLDCAESAVKWYLFDTRKKLKKELSHTMENTNFVYRPGKLRLAKSGNAPMQCDVDVINKSLTMQNIILACYPDSKNIDEIADALGIPKAYIESDLAWLVDREFLTESKSRYVMAIPIENRLHLQTVAKTYLDHKQSLCDVIIDTLLESEDEIRKIGFVGCDRAMDKLLWLMIFMYGQTQNINILRNYKFPLRPDGGHYVPLAIDESENQPSLLGRTLNTDGFGYNGGMTYSPFSWFGLYNYSQGAPMKLFDGDSVSSSKLRDMVLRCIGDDFDASVLAGDEQDLAAELIKDGFFTPDGSKYIPNFCVFTHEQFQALSNTVFAKVTGKIADEMRAIAAEFESLCKKTYPKHVYEIYSDFLINMALYDSIYYTEFFAMTDGKSYKPTDCADGEMLTLSVTLFPQE